MRNFPRPTQAFSSSAVCLLILIVGNCFPANVVAGGGPENLVLVVNADSASSKMIANTYVEGRGIPSRNVIYLSGIPTGEVTDLENFREKILKPILREIELRKLSTSVDYIVYSSDFPTVITNRDHFEKLKKQIEDRTGKEIQSKLYSANASITSLTYFADAIVLDEPGYMLLDSNAYYRQPAQVLLRRPFHADQQTAFQDAIDKLDSKDESEFKAAISTLLAMAKNNPRQLAVAYWLAKFYGKSGDAKNATAWLTRAIRLGWSYQKQTRADLAFENVKDDPVFRGIVDRIPDQPFDFVPTQGFKHVYRWGPNGMVNSEAGQGNRHFLSTVLAVTRNHGNTEKEALRQLKLTMGADESHPKGTFYFTDTSDVRVKTRKPNFGPAIDALESLGLKTKIVKSTMPTKARDVVGLTCGTSKFEWTKTGSKILPGTICDNLTSHGGGLHRVGQTKISAFLAANAAGASGTVIEPYAIQQKFPHPMIQVHYARGCSLAEAFYQSVHGPFQLLILGDALCQPWAKKPVLNVEGLEPGDTIGGKTEIKLDASPSPVSIGDIELYVDGMRVLRVPFRERLSFDSTQMTDGYHEIRIVSIANNSIETTGSAILPIQVDNKGIKTILKAEHADYLETDQISFQAKSNYGDSIELMHNGRALAKKIGRDVEFKVPANLLGRGKVSVVAQAISESGRSVTSMPIELQIDGRISDRKKDTQTKKKPPAKK